MDMTERLRAWGVAHGEARSAELAAQRGGPAEASGELRSRASALRERADRLHREIYRSLGRERDAPPS